MNLKDFAYLLDDGFDTAPTASVVLGIVKTLHSKGDPVTEANIKKILNHYKFAADDSVVKKVVSAYMRKVADKGKKETADKGAGLQEFKDGLKSSIGLDIKGLDEAKKLMSKHSLKSDVTAMINKTNANNMFSQHSDPKTRYDIQDGNAATSNFQIQLGGSSLKVPRPKAGKGGTSVTAVLVSKAILKACDASSEIAAHMGGEMKKAHKLSFDRGKVVSLTM